MSLKRIFSLQVILDFILKIDISKKLKNKLKDITAGFGNLKVKKPLTVWTIN
jgi:hypothetical protein